MSISKHFSSQVKNQSQVIDYQAVTPPPLKNRAKSRILCINFWEYFWRGGCCYFLPAVAMREGKR